MSKIISSREINRIILHCSDSDRLIHDDIKIIEHWHEQRGFDGIGYHYVVTKTKGIEVGRILEMQGAHTSGENKDSIGICLTGRNFFTPMQFELTADLIVSLIQTFGVDVKNIFGHREFNYDKTCPRFDVEKEIIRRVKGILLYEGH